MTTAGIFEAEPREENRKQRTGRDDHRAFEEEGHAGHEQNQSAHDRKRWTSGKRRYGLPIESEVAIDDRERPDGGESEREEGDRRPDAERVTRRYGHSTRLH